VGCVPLPQAPRKTTPAATAALTKGDLLIDVNYQLPTLKLASKATQRCSKYKDKTKTGLQRLILLFLRKRRATKVKRC
jgi:hypothetical protein